MEELPRISPEKLKALLHNCVDEFAEKMIDNVNAAQWGRLVADSEEGARQLIHEFGRAAYEAALQQKIDAAEASFSPSGGSGDRCGDEATRPEAPAE